MEGDGLPLHICLDCKSDVYYCFKFINCCKRTDDNLRKFLVENSQSAPEPTHAPIKEENDFKSSADEDDVDGIDADVKCCPIKLESNDSVRIENLEENKNAMSKLKVKLQERLHNRKKKRKKMCSTKSDERAISKKIKYYTCPFCHKSICDKAAFREHLSKEHDENKKFVCTICSKREDIYQFLIFWFYNCVYYNLYINFRLRTFPIFKSAYINSHSGKTLHL